MENNPAMPKRVYEFIETDPKTIIQKCENAEEISNEPENYDIGILIILCIIVVTLLNT